jgi:hypothetical protein
MRVGLRLQEMAVVEVVEDTVAAAAGEDTAVEVIAVEEEGDVVQKHCVS